MKVLSYILFSVSACSQPGSPLVFAVEHRQPRLRGAGRAHHHRQQRQRDPGHRHPLCVLPQHGGDQGGGVQRCHCRVPHDSQVNFMWIVINIMSHWPFQIAVPAPAVQWVAGAGRPGHTACSAGEGEHCRDCRPGGQCEVRLPAAACARGGVQSAAGRQQGGRQSGPPAGDWQDIRTKVEDDFHHMDLKSFNTRRAFPESLKFVQSLMLTEKLSSFPLKAETFPLPRRNPI